MKFAGLILICASSCLALLLPAIGVVKFPQVPHNPGSAAVLVNHIASSFPASTPNSANNPPPVWASTPPHTLPQSSFPSFQETSNSSVPGLANPFANPAEELSPKTTFQLGMGIWLLLLPVCLLGLAMWTLAPNPSGGKKN